MGGGQNVQFHTIDTNFNKDLQAESELFFWRVGGGQNVQKKERKSGGGSKCTKKGVGGGHNGQRSYIVL